MATSSSADQQPRGDRLKGKVAIVTGGGSGFGAGIAQRFAAEGCRVLISDINASGGERVAATDPAAIAFVKADVTSTEDWNIVVETCVRKFGRLDVLVNNAGTSYRNKVCLSPSVFGSVGVGGGEEGKGGFFPDETRGSWPKRNRGSGLMREARNPQPTAEVTESDFDLVMGVNVKSVFLGTQAVMPRLMEQGAGGCIVNIASVGASRPRPGLVWYNASKGAVANATKGLAAEYAAHGIRVNSINPLLSGTGLFETFAGVPDTVENRQKFLANVPMGRLTEPSDVAAACLFFASPDSAFVTGTALEVDGGRAI